MSFIIIFCKISRIMYSKSGVIAKYTQAYVCIMALPVDKRLDELDAGLIRQGFEVPVCVAEHRYPNHRWQRLRGDSPQAPKQSRNPGHGAGREDLMQSEADLPRAPKGISLHLPFAPSNEILMGRSVEACRDSRAHRGVTRDTVPARTEYQRTSTSDSWDI